MIAIVAHDAGGAEILASYVAHVRPECVLALDGPAVKVFERRLGAVTTIPVADAVTRADWLLTGTGWQSDIEWHALGHARVAGKRSVAFLDHWVNFQDRFVRDGRKHLPDEIWVGDEMALREARTCFPGVPIKLVPNPYFEDVRREIAARSAARLPREGGVDVLFVSEPIRDHSQRRFGDERHWGYTEIDALRYLLNHLYLLGKKVRSVTVRPHPAEPLNKYDWVTQEFGAGVVAGGRRHLFDEIADSDIVAGCESMAMVVALVAGRRVVCCIPPGGRPCSLPHAQIESLQTLVRAEGSR